MIDWSQAPEGAEYWCEKGQAFYKANEKGVMALFCNGDVWVESGHLNSHLKDITLFTPRPKDDEQRIIPDGIAQSVAKQSVPVIDSFLRGKNVVVTGLFSEFSREEIKDKLQQLGAIVKGSVDTNTFLVIAGRDAGVKLTKAKDQGICVWAEHDIVAYFKRHLPTPPPRNKYDRTIHGKYGTGSCTVDVYRVLNAFGPLSPEIDHAVKKLLAPGSRGHKDERQDLLEAIQSIEARLQYLEARDGD